MAIANELKRLRLAKGLSQQQIVDVIRLHHPKFDKTTLSKAERGEDYGIIIKRDALDALYRIYAPEMLKMARRERQGRHRLTKRVAARVKDHKLSMLRSLIEKDGYKTVQDWLTDTVDQYIERRNQCHH